MSEQAAAASTPKAWVDAAQFVACLILTPALSLMGLRALSLALDAFAPPIRGVTNGELLFALIAYAMCAASAVWTLVYIGVRRRRALRFGVGQLFAIALVTAVIDAAAGLSDSSNRGIAAADEQAALDAASKGKPIDMAIRASGDEGIIEVAYKHLLARSVENQRRYQAALRALGFPGIWSAASLGRSDLASVAQRLAQARKLIREQRAAWDANTAAFRVEIVNSAMSPAAKVIMLRQIDAQAAADRAQSQRYWDQEEQIANLDAQNVALMRANRTAWRFQGGAIRWSQADLLAAFNDRVIRIDQLKATERAEHLHAVSAARGSIAAPTN